VEQKLPENSYTKTTNDIFSGSWPSWFDRLFMFWFSYHWAVDINFLLAKYIYSDAPDNFLWLTIALIYILLEKGAPKIRTMATKWRYLLLFTMFVLLTVFVIWQIKYGLLIGTLKISITKA
jgi:hypothetical protein